MPTFCRYQCAAHHGVYVHTANCPVAPERPVCDGCAAEIKASGSARRKLTVGEAIIALIPGAEGAGIKP
jgi:hypothetical protein